MNETSLARFIVGVSILHAAACSDSKAQDGVEADVTTYQEHVRPLLEANCVSCHTQGGVAPFRLDDEASVMEMRAPILAAVKSRMMPPWPASDSCHDLRDVRALTNEQIEVFEAWGADGFLAGDEADYVPPDEIVAPELGDPDLILRPAESYVPDASIADEYRCFLTEGTFDTDTFITAMDIRPDVREQVHHVQVHRVSIDQLDAIRALDDAAEGSGYPCAVGVGVGIASVNLFSWRPGSAAVAFEPGDGGFIEANSAIVLQVHYNNQFLVPGEDPRADRSGVALWTMPAGELPDRVIVRTGQFGPVGPPSGGNILGMIPAGEPHVVGEMTQSLSALSTVGGQFVAGEIIGMTPHMHTLGTRLTSTLTRADGGDSCMIDVPDWDFEWQLDYYYATPETYGPEDTLTIRCEYDNSPGNQAILNGERLAPRDVTWGEGSLDEMCLNYVWFRYDREAFFAARGATP